MTVSSNDFIARSIAALQQPDALRTRNALGAHMPRMRSAAVDEFGDFEALREHVAEIRQHALDHLDHYLPRFEQEAIDNGNEVHYARTCLLYTSDAADDPTLV